MNGNSNDVEFKPNFILFVFDRDSNLNDCNKIYDNKNTIHFFSSATKSNDGF